MNINYMNKQELKDNKETILKAARNLEDLKNLFLELRNLRICDGKQLLKLLADNIQNIYEICGIYGIQEIMKNIPYILEFNHKTKSINKIDEFLAEKIDEIYQRGLNGEILNYTYFKHMKKLKHKIKKKGADFFIKNPLNSKNTIEECKCIAEDIYGEFTLEHLAKMKFGQYGEEIALIIQTIIKELLDQSREKNNIDNIEKIGEGGYSEVYRVGNYVLKFGSERKNETIPNHRRILQSIIKVKIPAICQQGDEKALIIEAQNLVDEYWYKGMDQKSIDEILFQIYAELRDAGLIWIDIKPSNVGRLLKPNTSNILYVDIDGKKKQIIPFEEGNGLIGKTKGKALGAGDIVILDDDYIIEEEGVKNWSSIFGASKYAFEFKLRYDNIVKARENEASLD